MEIILSDYLVASFMGVIFLGFPNLRAIVQLPFAIYFFVVCGCFKGSEEENDYGPPVDKVIW